MTKKSMMIWDFSSHHINLGPHNIPFQKKKIRNYLMQCDYRK
jgi:hypothetical protein